LAFVASLDLNKVIIATNNDNTKSRNHGFAAAMQIYLNLFSQYIDSDKLIIALPLSNDFSDMLVENKSFQEWYDKKVVGFNKNATIQYLIKKVKEDQSLPRKDKVFKASSYKLIPQLESLVS